MHPSLPLACFLSVIRPPGVQFDDGLLQILPVDKTKCPFVRDHNDIEFRLYTRHNPTEYQALGINDDEALFASNMNFHDPTVVYFGAFFEEPNDGSGLLIREAYMLKGEANFIILDVSRLEAGPWYFTAAENTWYIGNFAAKFIDYMVSRGLNLNNTHLIGHSLGAQSAGVAGSALRSGRVSRITGLDPALPLFDKLPLNQRLDPSDAEFVDVMHTDAGIFGFKVPIGHVDYYPNGGISPQPGCELEVVLHQPNFFNKCDRNTQARGFFVFHLAPNKKPTFEEKLHHFFTYINSVKRNTEDTVSDHIEDEQKENLRKSTPKLAESRKQKLQRLIYAKKHKTLSKSSHDYKRNEFDDIIEEKDNTYTHFNEEIAYKTPYENTDDQLAVEDVKIESKHDNYEIKSLNRDKRITDQDDINFDNKDPVNIESIDINSKDKNNDDQTSTFKRQKRSTHQTSPDILNKDINDGKTINITDDTNIEDITIHKELHNKNQKNITDAQNISASDIHTIITEKTTPKNTKIIDETLPKPKYTTEININEAKTKGTHPKIHFPNIPTSLLLENFRKITRAYHKNKLYYKNSLKSRKPRQKRFISFFRNSNENENFLFRMLDFLVKNRKNVLPVVTVMREINTLVKSGSGELNHFSKESNNYIGGLPTLTPIKYDLELGESGIVSFVKRLLGLTPRGGKLTVTGNK